MWKHSLDQFYGVDNSDGHRTLKLWREKRSSKPLSNERGFTSQAGANRNKKNVALSLGLKFD